MQIKAYKITSEMPPPKNKKVENGRNHEPEEGLLPPPQPPSRGGSAIGIQRRLPIIPFYLFLLLP